MFKGLSLAALTCVVLAPAAAWAVSAPPAVPAERDGHLIKVYEGCGPYGHRGPYGYCRHGGQWGGYIPGRSCPPGYHIGPYGRHCVPN